MLIPRKMFFPNDSHFPSGATVGISALCRGPVCLPVTGCHWWKAGQAHKQQFATGRALRSWLWLAVHRWASAGYCPLILWSHGSYRYLGLLEASGGGHKEFFLFVFFQCLWSWAPVSLCSWARIQTGCSSAASRACSCFTVPTGKPMSPVPCALACECEHGDSRD